MCQAETNLVEDGSGVGGVGTSRGLAQGGLSGAVTPTLMFNHQHCAAAAWWQCPGCRKPTNIWILIQPGHEERHLICRLNWDRGT